MTAEIDGDVLSKLAALEDTVISRPSSIELPSGLGLFAMAVAVALPKGCLPPPGPLGFRVAAGWGMTPDEASAKAALEGAERFSIQYQEGDPAEFFPCRASGTHGAAYPATKLLLGHPVVDAGNAPKQLVTSVGAAAGASVDDAAVRAILEKLEHQKRQEWLAGKSEGAPLAVDSIPELANISRFNADSERKLALFALPASRSVVVVMCVSCASDGTAAVAASAASTDLTTASVDATVEATLLWRNMMALTARGIDFNAISPTDREHIARYIGGWPLETLPADDAQLSLDLAAKQLSIAAFQERLPPDLYQLMSEIDEPLRVFDFTRPEASVPVARVVFGSSN